MKKKLKAVKESKRLAALLIVAVTAAYLGLTAAFAQTSVTSNNGAKVAYDPDYLSFGDMYAFTEAAYESSNYGLTNTKQTVSLYSSTAADANTATNCTFYQYYGTVKTGDHSNVSNGVEMKNHAYTEYHSGYTRSTAPAAVDGETVPTLATAGTGVYSLVPYSTGSYRIYVYSQSDPTGHVTYELIDSYTKANAYAGAPSQPLTFTQVPGTDYWYAPVEVSTLSWSAYKISAAKAESTAGSQTNDTNGGTTYTGKQGTNATLGSDYYYNVWTAEEIFYDTLLTIRWDSTVQLAPVTKLADTITITNSDPSMGSLTAVNAFGETVAVGSAVAAVHAPVYITAVPASEEYAFAGFGGAEVSLVDAEQGIYKYGFEADAALTGNWTEKESLPTIRITGDYTGTMDFFAATSATTQIVSGTASNYTLTVDYTGAADTESVTYTVTRAGTAVESGTVTESSNTIQVSAQWDAVTVSITATGASGNSYTAVFTVNISNAGLVDVAQIGTTKYQYIEDALAAATSGQTITIISSKVSFVAADTVPAAWTADADGDGQPDGYTVKAGVTLIIPYSTAGTLSLTSSSDDHPYALQTLSATNTNALATDESYEYRKLTVPEGKALNVAGTVATGGTLSSITGVSGGTNGSVSETYSVLEVNGAVNVLNGGIVTSCGYVYGSGVLNAVSGAKLYQPMVIMDFRGGGYTVGAAGKSYALGTQSGESYVSPFTRYVTQNIQTDVRMEEGALMYGYCDLYTSSTGGHNRTCGVLVGSASKGVDGLVKLSAGAVLTTTYDKNDVVSTYARVGRLDVFIEGGASFGTLTLTAMSQEITTNELTFPIPYNYGFYLNGEGSVYTIAYSMALLPGATLEVGEGATLNVGNNSSGFRFIAFDGFYDHTASGGTSNPYTVVYGTQKSSSYPTTAVLQAAGRSGTSDLIVNGTLNINSGVNFGGVVQAGSSSAVLNMDSAATASCKVQMGLVGSKKIIVNTYYFAGATIRDLSAQVIDRGTGRRTDVVAGKTYHGSEGSDVISDYTYDLYTTSASTSTKETHTETLNAAVEGSWYNYTATICMVNDSGTVLSTQKTYFCHGADVSDFYLDAACTQAASTVTEEGMTLYSNNVEARIEWADGSAATYYASLRSAVKDAVHTGDKVVLMKDITLGNSIPIDGAQNITLSLADNGTAHTIAYTTTPFINSGTLTLDLGGGTITNCVDEAYASAPAFTNNDGGTASIDLNGGSMIVQAPVGQEAQFNAVVNYGTLSVADTAGNGGIYCYGPLGADESGWKDITLTTNLGGKPTATVKAEIYANTLAAETIYTGIYNTGTIAEISGGTIRSPMYGVYSGSAAAVAYRGSYDLAKAKIAAASAASIGSISGGIFQGGYAGLMNDGASIGSITGGTFESTGTMFVSDASANYSGLYNAFGTVGNVSNASFLSNDAFTLTRYRFTFNADGTQEDNTTNTTINSVYGIYNYGALWTDTTAAAGYSYFAPTLGNLTNCTIEAVGTELVSGVLNGSYTGTYTGTVNNANGTALMNYGTVGNITGGSITGNRGIVNNNIVFTLTVYDTGSSSTYLESTATRRVVSVGTIGDIRDCDVTAYYQYALLNYGTVGSLCGSSTFTTYAKSTYGYAVYNHGGWYNGTVNYQTITEREAYTNASGSTAYRNTKVTNVYDDPGKAATGLDDAASVWTSIPLPTIDSIADGVTITSVNNTANVGYGYALSNAGRINSIGGGTGTVTIQTYNGDSATVKTSNYGLYNSAYIGSIGDNVKISATGERALQNSGNRLTQQVTTYTYATNDAATVKATDVVYNYCVPAYIGSIGAATVSAGTQYGILNYAWISSLTGTTITTGTGAYGISNQGDSSASYLHTLTYVAAYAPSGYNPDDPGYLEEYTRFGAKIGTITDASITAGSTNAISNNGEIGAITGSTTLTATTNNALNNGDSYQTGHVLKRYNLGQIDEVTTGHYITLQEKNYSYAEGGSYIGEISGNVKITATGGNYGLINSGTIGTITGANISAEAYAIQNSSAYRERTTFWYCHGANPLVTTQYLGETNVSYAKAPAFIETISNVTAEARTKNYAFANFGKIGAIDGCSFTAQTQNALYNGYNNVARYELNLPESTGNGPAYLDWVEKNAAGNGYVFRLHERTESYMIGRIGTITNTEIKSVQINDEWVAALGNCGFIETIGDGTSIEVGAIGNSYIDRNYALRNYDDVRSSVHITMTDITDEVSEITGNSKFYTQYYREYGYGADEYGTEAVSMIGAITGNVTIQMPNAYGIFNQGKIDKIENGVNVTAQKSALANSGGYYTEKTTIQIYEGTSRLDGTSQLGETIVSYTKEMPQIGTIDGAIIKATGTTTSGTAISNSGKISKITNSIVQADYDFALSNTGYITSSYTFNDTDMIGLAPASVMKWNGSKFVADTSNKSEVTNTEAIIDELGEGNEFTAGNNYAVQNSGTGRAIRQITGGIYTAGGTNGYAVYNGNASAPIYISAGDFKGGTNTDSTQGRAYAIYNPDDPARQTYPEDMSLTPAGRTRTVTFADGTTADGYYYIGILNPVAQIINGGGLTEYTSLAQAVAAYTAGVQTGDTDTGLPYIQMMDNSEEPGFTISTDVYLDLNGKTVTLTDGGTLTIEAGAVLYGMDTATDGYSDESYGKIVGTVSGDVSAVTATYRAGGALKRYAADTGAVSGETSFHRFNLSVTSYTFHFSLNGDCNMAFGATFRGSKKVIGLLEDIGFAVTSMADGTEQQAWQKEQLGSLAGVENGGVLQGTLVKLTQADQFTTTYQIEAVLKLNELTPADDNFLFRSVARQINYLGALKTYYNNGATEEQKAAIDSFVEKWALQDAWGN